VERVLIHPEPAEQKYVHYALPLADHEGTLATHLGTSPYFALVTVHRADGAITEQRILANPYRHEEKAKGIQVAEWLVREKVDVLLVKELPHGKGPSYVFGRAGTKVEQTAAASLREVLPAIQTQEEETESRTQ
jgi:predicted Fe-Mo cluster-binding NifX family protein